MLARASRISHPPPLPITPHPSTLTCSTHLDIATDFRAHGPAGIIELCCWQVIPGPSCPKTSLSHHFLPLTFLYEFNQTVSALSLPNATISQVKYPYIYISIFQLSFTSSTYINITVLRDWYLSNVPLIPLILLSWPSRNTWNGFSCHKVHIQITNAVPIHVIPELKTFSSLRRDFWTNKPSFWALNQDWRLNEKVMPCWNNSNIK